MAEKKVNGTTTVGDFTEAVKEINGLVRENYLNGVEFALSLWEENQKVLNAQMDKWLKFEKDYADSTKEVYERLPKEMTGFWNGRTETFNREVDRYVAFQKEYFSSVRSLSDKFTKDTVSLTQKNVERAFAFFDEYLGKFRV